MKSRSETQQPGGSSHIDNRPNWLLVVCVLLILGLAFVLRCLHLLNNDHFFVVSPDSHYFHHMAQLLVQDETYFYPTHGQLLPATWASGVTYPLAAAAKAIELLTPASSGDALELAGKLLPPALGAATALVLFLAVAQLYGRRAGLLSAFAWAVASMAVFHQAAGYLDRDCLSILLIVVGVFLFYHLSHPRTAIGSGKLNWLACGLAVVGIEALLYVEWGFLGPAILITILASFLLLQTLNNLVVRVGPTVLREEDPLRMPLTFARGALRALPTVLERSAGRAVAFIVGLNLAVAAFRPSLFRGLYYSGVDIFRGAVGGEQTVAELQGTGVSDILSYWFLLIPAVIGLYVCAKRRNRADLLVLGWFAILFLGGLFAKRLFIYAAPPICILSGLGLVALLQVKDFRPSLTALLALPFVNPRGLVPYLRVCLGIMVILLSVLLSSRAGYLFASAPPTAVDNDWHDALLWLRENTPEDAVIITWWDYGYWILDVAHRVPVVDNGVHPETTDEDIRRLYLAGSDAEAVDIMTRYGAGYLIFSKAETRFFADLDADFGHGSTVPPDLRDSLYVRSFSETFHSDAGLQRVYQTARTPDTSVLILALT